MKVLNFFFSAVFSYSTAVVWYLCKAYKNKLFLHKNNTYIYHVEFKMTMGGNN